MMDEHVCPSDWCGTMIMIMQHKCANLTWTKDVVRNQNIVDNNHTYQQNRLFRKRFIFCVSSEHKEKNRSIRDQNKELTVQEAKGVVTGEDRAILEADQEASNEGGADLGLEADNDDKNHRATGLEADGGRKDCTPQEVNGDPWVKQVQTVQWPLTQVESRPLAWAKQDQTVQKPMTQQDQTVQAGGVCGTKQVQAALQTCAEREPEPWVQVLLMWSSAESDAKRCQKS